VYCVKVILKAIAVCLALGVEWEGIAVVDGLYWFF